jgi:hypothetical protein
MPLLELTKKQFEKALSAHCENRIPVAGPTGQFMGIISRGSLLRTGFENLKIK